MKNIKRILLIAILLFSAVALISCKPISPGPDNEPDEKYINIASLSAEKFSNNITPVSKRRLSRLNLLSNEVEENEEITDTPEHGHIYQNSICMICGAVDPSHNHKYVDGKCSICNADEPHVHEFVYGKCECGAKDPDYIVEGLIPKGQYVIMYKSESEIQFTITLDNPKGEAIDAIELTCDDPNSQIMMDGKYENIQYSDDKTVIVNWSQENPYKKTYQIKTTSEETIQTLKVVDIKVNGEWQNKELSNDELKIYKIEDNDVAIKTVNNNIEEYSFNVVICENVKRYDVIFNDKYIEADETGTYRVNEDGQIKIRYVYDFNGTDVEWEVEKDIELFGFELGYHDPNLPGYAHLNVIFISNGVRLVFSGTDIKNEKITYIYNNGEDDTHSITLNFFESESGYSIGMFSSLPEQYRFEKYYDWSYYPINKIERTKFYIQYGTDLYQIVIDLEYNIRLELIK